MHRRCRPQSSFLSCSQAEKKDEEKEDDENDDDEGPVGSRGHSAFECEALGRTCVATPRERLARAKAILRSGRNERGGGLAGGGKIESLWEKVSYFRS